MPFHAKNPRNPAPGITYYTPAQNPPAGTATEDDKASQKIPTLFTPITLRNHLTLHNRFVVSPMCTYSADNGHLTDWHLVHLGSFAQRGAALTIVEATAVLPNGRISPEDSGLWQDSQIGPLKRIVEYVHSQGQKIGIQLAHAGRKASVLSGLGRGDLSWGHSEVASEEQDGWPDNVWGPSAIPFSKTGYANPKEMSLDQIGELVEAFKAAAKRAVEAGVDTIEIHGAHGYLISEFLSPISNRRTDQYGGSFENRTRLLLETVQAVRSVIPETMPLFVRISATEWMEWTGQPSWDVEQSIKLALILADSGVDLLDVSTGGNNEEQKIQIHPYYQLDIAGQIREVLKKEGKLGKMLIGGVGMVNNAEMARDVVEEGEGKTPKADLVLVARQFLREPEFVLRTAEELGVKVAWPTQYARAPFLKKREKKL